MQEIMEKLNQAKRILTGDEGPKLTLDRDEDARYIYPTKIKEALKVLCEIEYLLTSACTRRDNAWLCPGCLDEIKGYRDDHCAGCGKSRG